MALVTAAKSPDANTGHPAAVVREREHRQGPLRPASRMLHQEAIPGTPGVVQRHGDKEVWLTGPADPADDARRWTGSTTCPMLARRTRLWRCQDPRLGDDPLSVNIMRGLLRRLFLLLDHRA